MSPLLQIRDKEDFWREAGIDELQMVPLSDIGREILIWTSVEWLPYTSFL